MPLRSEPSEQPVRARAGLSSPSHELSNVTAPFESLSLPAASAPRKRSPADSLRVNKAWEEEILGSEQRLPPAPDPAVQQTLQART